MKNKRQNGSCSRCLFTFGCHKKNLLPVIGECTRPGKDRRGSAIRDILKKLEETPRITPRKMVKVTGDFLGCPYEIPVKRIERATFDNSTPEFAAGPDEYGEMVTSRLLSTEDILSIRAAL